MTNKLFIGNVSYEMSSDDLREAFAKFGDVVDANIVMDKNSGRSRGFGFVEMKTEDEAKKAMEGLNGQEIGGRKIFVSEAKQKQEDPQK